MLCGQRFLELIYTNTHEKPSIRRVEEYGAGMFPDRQRR